MDPRILAHLLAHQLILAYLLKSAGEQSGQPSDYLEKVRDDLSQVIPGLRMIKSNPELEDETLNVVVQTIASARRSIEHNVYD